MMTSEYEDHVYVSDQRNHWWNTDVFGLFIAVCFQEDIYTRSLDTQLKRLPCR